MAYLINCPHCGPRTTDEFYIKGDASKLRPGAIGDDTMDQWHDYVHIRDNVRGRTAEHWHHTGGCRQWLVVERDTVSHEIYAVTPASTWAASGGKGSSTPAAHKATGRKTATRKTPARKATSRKTGGRAKT